MDKKKKKHFRTKCPCEEKRTNSLTDKVATLMYRFGKNPEQAVIDMSISDIILLLGQENKISKEDYEILFSTYLSRASVRSLIKFAEKYGNEDKRDAVLDAIFSRRSFIDGVHLFLNAIEREHKIKGIKMMKDRCYHSFTYSLYRALQHHDLLISGKVDGTLKKELKECLSEWQKILEFEKEIGCDYKDSEYRVEILKKILDPNVNSIQLN